MADASGGERERRVFFRPLDRPSDLIALDTEDLPPAAVDEHLALIARLEQLLFEPVE
jgi:hypothetical protein